MKPDWDYIRSYLVAKDFQQPSTTEETERHQLQIAYLVEHEVLKKANNLGGSPDYRHTEAGTELVELMTDDALWERTRVELIDNLKATAGPDVPVRPDVLLNWLKKPSKLS